MPIPAALKRMAASMLLTVITAADLKSPRQSHTAQFPWLDQPRRGEAEKMHLCAANSAGESGAPYSAR